MDKEYDSDNSETSPFQSATWKTAIDSNSGKVYYYDEVSKKAQWKKPLELKAQERKRKKERRRVARLFFDEMEKNILKSLSRGEMIPGIQDQKIEGPPKEPLPKSHVRTISAMYGVLLEELGANIPRSPARGKLNLKRKPKEVTSEKPNGQSPSRPPLRRPPLARRSSSVGQNKSPSANNATPQRGSPTDRMHSPLEIAKKSEKPPVAKPSRLVMGAENSLTASTDDHSKKKTDKEQRDVPSTSSIGHTRRNTEGTIYLQSTMTNPDVQATIKCVCGLFRAHITQSSEDKNAVQKEKARLSLEFNVFDDDFDSTKPKRQIQNPSLEEITEFYEAFYQRSQMEHDTIIFSLIYVERLIKSTNGILAPTPQNWRSLLFSCMVMASKVWDDFSMWNYDFANVTAHTSGFTMFTISRINELELALLKSLKHNVKVSASEYAKYYFLIRNMLLGSGLVKEDMEPLGKREGSRELGALHSQLFGPKLTTEIRDRRTKSMDGKMLTDILQNEGIGFGDSKLKDPLYLKQLVPPSVQV